MKALSILLSAVLLSLVLVGQGEAQEKATLGPVYSSITGPTAAGELYYDVSINTYQALTTAIRFSDADDIQKLNIAPMKLRRDLSGCSWWCELAVNVTQRGGISTFGLGWGYSSAAPYSPKNARVAETLNRDNVPAKRPPRQDEKAEEYAAYEKLYREQVLIGRIYTPFFEKLVRNSFGIKAAANAQTFGILAGTPVDLDMDGKIDNDHRLKAWDLALGGEFTPSLNAGVSGTFHLTRKRASAAEGEPLITYHGGSVTGGVRVHFLNPDYKTTEPYLKRLFIPSVVLGTILEYQRCRGETAECEDHVRSQFIATPFVDVRISEEAQFRFGLPFKRTRVAAESSTQAHPIFQLGFQLSGL